MIEVQYKRHSGSDKDVVNAARVSFNREIKPKHYKGVVGTEYGIVNLLREQDENLIKYLAKHNHWSPFSHCFVTFKVKAPIFVARQLQKHTVGLAWNEISRRYVEYTPEFYSPDTWRKTAENKKQGSSDETVSDPFLETYDDLMDVLVAYYSKLIEMGVCPEQARMVLPQSTYTEWIWSGSLYAFSRVCNLRMSSDAQKETQYVANKISETMACLFPYSWKYLVPTQPILVQSV